MRPYIKGENVEDYLVEFTNELVNQRPTTGTFVAPRLTEAERDILAEPLTLCTGMIVFNTTSSKLNFCDDPSNATPANRWSVVTSS